MLRAYVVFKNRVFYRGLAHALLYLSRREKTCTLLTSVPLRGALKVACGDSTTALKLPFRLVRARALHDFVLNRLRVEIV